MAVADTSEQEIPFLDRNAEAPVAFPMQNPAPSLPLGSYGSDTFNGVFDHCLWIYFNDLDFRRRYKGVFGGIVRRRFR